MLPRPHRPRRSHRVFTQQTSLDWPLSPRAYPRPHTQTLKAIGLTLLFTLQYNYRNDHSNYDENAYDERRSANGDRIVLRPMRPEQPAWTDSVVWRKHLQRLLQRNDHSRHVDAQQHHSCRSLQLLRRVYHDYELRQFFLQCQLECMLSPHWFDMCQWTE